MVGLLVVSFVPATMGIDSGATWDPPCCPFQEALCCSRVLPDRLVERKKRKREEEIGCGQSARLGGKD